MKNVADIEKMIRTANEIKQGFAKMDKYNQNKQHYDKTGMGFNLDSRFAACKGINLYVSSWMGVYGDSGCSNILNLNEEIFNRHLNKVLNKNFKSIMNEVAESIMKEATTLKEAATKELQEKLAAINSL